MTAPDEKENYLVKMKDIHKNFGNVEALKGVNIKIRENEIIGLVGDNGAGKTTLIRILTGFYDEYQGQVKVKGEEVNFKTPQEARERGIEVVYQNLGLVNLLTVSRNFFLGREITKNIFGFIKKMDHKKMNEISNRVIKEVGITREISSDSLVSVLSGGERQAINIGRAIYFDCDLLILDEPTTALSVRETEWVFRQIKEIREKGVSVIFISHNINDAYEVADRFILLERGKVLSTPEKKEVTAEEVKCIIRDGKSKEA